MTLHLVLHLYHYILLLHYRYYIINCVSITAYPRNRFLRKQGSSLAAIKYQVLFITECLAFFSEDNSLSLTAHAISVLCEHAGR